MIESNIIEWLDFEDSAQNLDIYSKKHILIIFKFFRNLIKNKYFPAGLNQIFVIIFFIQLFTLSSMFISAEGDLFLEILDYLKKVTIFSTIINNESNYRTIFIITLGFIIIDFILMIFFILLIKKVNLSFIFMIIYFFNILIFYYFIGPIIQIFIITIMCDNGIHKYLGSTCYSNTKHFIFIILSFIMLILSLLLSFLHSFYCNEIELITTNIIGSNARINCNYELFCLISKIIIFFLSSYLKRYDIFLYKLIYEIFIFIYSLIMSFYVYKYVYYYNNLNNYINFFGWYFTCWLSFCVFLKIVFKLEFITNLIIIGWVIIAISFYKSHKMKQNSLITESNIFELNSIKSIEMYKNIILKKLSERNNYESKILLFGIIKRFEEFAINNPEINFQYQKLLNDKILNKKFRKEDDLPILSIIYILYSYYLDKSSDKGEIIIHMCYFLINKLNNPTYAMLLCSKLKRISHKSLFYKYLLAEDIKEYLIFKLNKNSNKESIKHVQISSVILYNSYTYLFKIKIYDAICNQIEYLDLLKNNVATNKITENFLKNGEIILNLRKEILIIWGKLIELNPFSDEYQKDYLLYLDTIIQDEILVREEIKKYMLLKNKKYQERNNIYHSMFLNDKSSILLVDGYLTNGKLLYSSPNFSILFMHNVKELLNITIDDLIPNTIQTFHKELIEDAIKYSNINYIFKKPKDSLLKNKIGGLYNVKIFIKPVPNLSYGLIYYIYLQKIFNENFIIILDNDLKINGFTEMNNFDSSFTINDGFNLSQNIIGYHIGLIIPDILFFLKYKNEEFKIIKLNSELKGYLYPVERIKDIKYKLDIILDKIKNNKFNDNNFQGPVENDPQNISSEFNEYIRELNNQKIKPISIFYKVKLHTFINNKYRYYRIYINHDILSDKENISLMNQIIERKNTENINRELKGIINKSQNESQRKVLFKPIERKTKKIVKDIYNKENSLISLNENNNNDIIINKESKNIKNENKVKSNNNLVNNENINKEKKIFNDLDSFAYYDSELNNYDKNIFNTLKNDIIHKKEPYPIKINFYLSILFVIFTIAFMNIETIQLLNSFNSLAQYLEDNLFFNKTKILSAIMYITGVNIRWGSHSLYLNRKCFIKDDCLLFYRDQLNEIIDYLEAQKNESTFLGDDFKNIITSKQQIELYFYKFDETEKYYFNLDNLLTFLINIGIKILDTYSYFSPNNCQDIPKEIGFNETNLKNLIEISYYFYNSDINGFQKEEKIKKINKLLDNFLFLMLYSLILLVLLIVYIHYILSLHHIELYFLEKLINFHSTNFDNYFTKIDDIKKKLRNDNNEDEDKLDDMDYNDLDSNKREEEDKEKNDNTDNNDIDEKNNKLKLEKKKKKKEKNKQSKLLQQKKKKIKIMNFFFRKNNILFVIKILLIFIISLFYYFISMYMKNDNKTNFLKFDEINNSIDEVFKESFDIFISLKRKLDIYERNLINCKKIGNFEKMVFPKIDEISFPILGNLLLQISDSSDYDDKTLNELQLLFTENSCNILFSKKEEIAICENFWAGILVRGLEQAITQMGVIIGPVLDELESLNDIKNEIALYNLMEQSSFVVYEQFVEYYLLKSYNKTSFIFKSLRKEKSKAIIEKKKIVLIIFLIISVILFGIFIFFIYSLKNLFNSFLNFICILPLKYLSEDEHLFNEIVKFGNKYF